MKNFVEELHVHAQGRAPTISCLERGGRRGKGFRKVLIPPNKKKRGKVV